MTYVSVSQEQLREALDSVLEGKLPESARLRVVGRQVHLIYRRFGRGGWFYLSLQARMKPGARSISHQGLGKLLREGAAGFLGDAMADQLAPLQLRELMFRFARSGRYYLQRGGNGLHSLIPEATQRAIFRTWYLGGEGAEPEILNTHDISCTKLAEIVSRGQAEGWMRSEYNS